VRILGLDLRSAPARHPGARQLSSAYVTPPANLTAWEKPQRLAKLCGIRKPRQKILTCSELFEIPQTLHRVTGALSDGQLTRLNLCKAF
jgi:ABC-2 type transport system ATP-binding protein